MKRLISIALSLSLALSMLPAPALAVGFSDMPDSTYWSYTALKSAVDNKLLSGYDGKLMPKDALTRAQMATIINHAFGATDTADISKFSDVRTSDWFYSDIAKAVRMGTFAGDGTNLMNPNKPITREQAFTVLSNAFHLKEGNTAVLDDFTDGAQVSSYARGFIAALVEAGYITGSDGKLLPKDSISREQFAQVMYNMLQHYISAEGTYTDDLTGNVIINVPSVVLKDMTVDGDLIIGEGVGNGEITLDAVNVTGRLIVRGGGENSIIIKNKSSVGNVIVSKTGDGGVRLYTEEGCRVDVVNIPDGKDNIVLEGTFNEVNVTTDAPILFKSADVTSLTVSGENASIATQGKTNITSVVIDEKAAGATMTVDAGSTIAKVESAAEKVTIDGKGTVTQVTVSGNNTAVNTKNTSITTTESVSGVTAGGKDVAAGTTDGKPTKPGTSSSSSGSSGSSGGSSSSGSGSSTPSTPAVNPENVKSLSELKRALSSGAKYIKVTGLVVVEKDKLVVSEGQTLEIVGGLLLTGKNASLTNNGTIINKTDMCNYTADGEREIAYIPVGNANAWRMFSVDNGATLINYGEIYNEKDMGIYHASMENHGMLKIQVDAFVEVYGGSFINHDEDTDKAVVVNNGVFFVGDYDPADKQFQDYNGKMLYGKSTKASEPTATFGGELEHNGQFVLLGGVVNFDGIVKQLKGMDIENGIYARNTDININGTFNNCDVFHMDNGTLNIAGSYSNIGISKMTSEEGLTLNISGTYVNGAGGFYMDGCQVTIAEGGTFENNGGFHLSNAVFTNNGTFNGLAGEHTNYDSGEVGENHTAFQLSKVENNNTWWNGNSFNVDSGESRENRSAVTNNGQFFNNGHVFMDRIDFINNKTFRNGSEDNRESFLHIVKSRVTNNGNFNNYGYVELGEDLFTNSADALMNSGFASDTMSNDGIAFVAFESVINNDGTWINEAEMSLQEGSATGESVPTTFSSIKNSSSFQNGSRAHVWLYMSSFEAKCHLVNNGHMDLFDSDFFYQGSGKDLFENSGLMSLVGGSFKVHEANKDTFKNEGRFEIEDRYGSDDGDLICDITVGKDNFVDDSGWLYYTATVYDQEGMKKALEIQDEKLHKNESSDYIRPAYNKLRICGDITLSEDTDLSIFPQVQADGNWYWDEETEQDGFTPTTLTIQKGAVLTLSGLLDISTATLVNHGTIECIHGLPFDTHVDEINEYIPCDAQTRISEEGGYAGDGAVECNLTVVYQEGLEKDSDNLAHQAHEVYNSYIIANAEPEKTDYPKVYVIENDTEIISIDSAYNVSNDTVILGHFGKLEGKALDRAEYEARTMSALGMKAGALATKNNTVDGKLIFDRVVLVHGAEVALRENLMFRNHLHIDETAGLVIDDGVIVETHGHLGNFGDMNIFGTLEIWNYAENNQSMNVGDITGGQEAAIVVHGWFENRNYLYLNANGKLVKGGDGEFWNDGSVVGDGKVEGFKTKN